MTTILVALFLATLHTPERQTLVTTHWLANHLDDPNVIVLEIRKTQTPMIHTHIPNAHSIALNEIVVDKNGLRDELPPIEKLREAFENAAIGDSGDIII